MGVQCKQSKCANAVVGYVETQWMTGLTIKNIAVKFELYPTDVGRIFRREKGITIHRYIDKCRKDKLLELLKDGHPCGYEIGYLIGFQNDITFYRWVKRTFGVPYSELRRQIPHRETFPQPRTPY
jgi:YesN/AraC family two-component response regulator